MAEASRIACIGCGAQVPDSEGASFRYPNAGSPGCWAVFGQILAREFENPLYFPEHRLSVDTYAIQHPGDPTPQTIQSVNVHLMALCLTFDYQMPSEQVTTLMGRSVRHYKGRLEWLEPPTQSYEITVNDVVQARTPDEHLEWVRRWARHTWEVWQPHHAVVRRQVAEVIPSPPSTHSP